MHMVAGYGRLCGENQYIQTSDIANSNQIISTL